MQKELFLKMFQEMVLIRTFEKRLGEIFKLGEIPGFVHLSLGQEAAAVGICENLRQDDYLTSTHRGHHHCIAKGVSLNGLMAELFGKKTGSCKGRGGSMHIAQASVGVLGTNGIVGDGISIAAGAGLSAKLRKTGQVVACFFGDGALTAGAFHEGINLIAIHRLPVVLVCENNYYAVSMKLVDAFIHPHQVVEFAQRYGMPVISVDANDVLAVYEVGKEAVARARVGEGPTFIECKTLRQAGHFEGDPDRYRTGDELKKGMALDPIPRLRGRLISEGILTEEDVEKITKETEWQIEEAIKFSRESPWPDQSEVLIEY